jgi:hypothetical protein
MEQGDWSDDQCAEHTGQTYAQGRIDHIEGAFGQRRLPMSGLGRYGRGQGDQHGQRRGEQQKGADVRGGGEILPGRALNLQRRMFGYDTEDYKRRHGHNRADREVRRTPMLQGNEHLPRQKGDADHVQH